MTFGVSLGSKFMRSTRSSPACRQPHPRRLGRHPPHEGHQRAFCDPEHSYRQDSQYGSLAFLEEVLRLGGDLEAPSWLRPRAGGAPTRWLSPLAMAKERDVPDARGAIEVLEAALARRLADRMVSAEPGSSRPIPAL